MTADRHVAGAVRAADDLLSWSGASLAAIRTRWDDHGPQQRLLDLTSQDRIPADLEHDVLEQLRRARSDVHYLLQLLDTATATS